MEEEKQATFQESKHYELFLSAYNSDNADALKEPDAEQSKKEPNSQNYIG